jgi:hypothetical protein
MEHQRTLSLGRWSHHWHDLLLLVLSQPLQVWFKPQ